MKKLFIHFILLSFLVLCPVFASAQNKTALTITPPLIKNNVNPGQIWKSYLKVVNNSENEIEVYVQLINFESGSESGTVRLTPLSEEEIEGNEYLVNNWIVIDEGPISIEAYNTKVIPFIVDVPEKADPGDHHVAMLVGTKPPKSSGGGSSVKISSMLGSLLLLNVGGEVNESGIVREFTSDKGFYGDGEVKFTLRFQNTGNTILQPRGDIRIYDLAEKEQGYVSINHKTNTGNVFPEDIRRWEFSWPVPESLLKMGRYRAEMVLSYGDKTKEVSESKLYFWVIHLKPLLIFFGSIMFFILLITLLVRRSIKKAVLRTQEQFGISKEQSDQEAKQAIASGNQQIVVDLKAGAKKTSPQQAKQTMKKKSAWKLIKRLTLVLVTALFVVLVVLAFLYYKNSSPIIVPIKELSNENILEKEEESEDSIETEFQEEILDSTNEGQDKSISGDRSPEKPASSSLEELESEINDSNIDKAVSINIQNGSGIAGAAAKAKQVVEEAGFRVTDTGNADKFDYQTTVFSYDKDFQKEAELLAQEFAISPELRESNEPDFDINIVLGSDFK